MNARPDWQTEIHELLDRLYDGDFNESDRTRLNELLGAGAPQRECFITYMDVHSRLTWDGVCGFTDENRSAFPIWPTGDIPPVDNPDAPPRRHDSVNREPVAPFPTLVTDHSSRDREPFVGSPLFACMVATAVLAVMLLGAWLYKISTPELPAVERSRSIATLDAPLPAIVGRVTGLHECRWTDADAETFLGAPVRLDRKYSLDAGMLEITYSTGARVILEGRCDYVVESRAGGYLAVGKLIARVEAGIGESGSRENRSGDSTSSAPLFAVRTPLAVVTDLGTEFGVIVGEDGDTATHVIEGRVELRVLDDDRPENQAIRIAAGESVHVERPAKDTKDDLAAVARGKADADLFPVHPGKLTEYVAEKRLEPFRRWQAFSDELCKRDDLVDYWDFQRDRKNPLVLRNRAPGGHDGTIEGARWAPGRFPGKQALRFSYSSHRVRVRISDKIAGASQLTLAAWVCNEDVAKHRAALLAVDRGWDPDSIYWEWRIHKSRPRLLLNVRQRHDQSGGVGSLRPLITEGQWSFIIVTYDLEKHKGASYFNGELSSETGSTQPDFVHNKAFAPYDYLIGNCYLPNAQLLADLDDRSFKGSIGELMIFNKVLSPDEIGRIYEEGTATPSDKTDSAIGE